MDKKRIKLLIISGGGIFGMIPINFLCSYLKEDWFEKVDFLAGTSVGGIISLYLATGKPVGSLKKTFSEDAEKIFKLRWYKKLLPFIGTPKYYSEPIEHFLKKEIVGRMGDLVKPVIIPTVSFKNETLRVFDNLNGSIDLQYEAWKVARATSAAPTYFPPFGEEVFIDGGIVENIPLITAISTIRSRYNVPLEDIDVFIIGCGSRDILQRDLKEVESFGYIDWFNQFLSPFVTKANEMSSQVWGENIGLGFFVYYNPIVIRGDFTDANLIKSGKLNGYCETYYGDFEKKFSEFLNFNPGATK